MNEAAVVHVTQNGWQKRGKGPVIYIRQLATTMVLAAGYGVDPLGEEGKQLRSAIYAMKRLVSGGRERIHLNFCLP